MEVALRVNAPAVVGEIIDGEAVIMDLASGHYFSTQGSGADIWAAIAAGMGRAAITEMLAATYRVERSELARAMDAFIGELIDRRLVIEEAARETATTAPEAAAPAAAPRAFVAPVLNAYADMEDILLLDPIHDVDAVGWPVARPVDQPAP